MTTELHPLWEEFPDIPWNTAGWRMGWGEEYANKWHTWFTALGAKEQSLYMERWPEPPEWEGYFDYLIKQVPPPWKIEREQKIAAAAQPPAIGEDKIYGSYRILWMLRKYLRRPKLPIRSFGRHERILVDPNGDTWTLVEMQGLEPGKLSEPYLLRFYDQLIGEDNLEVKRPIL